MSDAIRHECGLAYIRLLKPLAYYHRKYGTAFYGLNKLYLLMEKQHNRGQDGAGIASVKLNVTPGHQFMYRQRKNGAGAIASIFQNLNGEVAEMEKMYPEIRQYPGLMKGYMPFMGECLMGHLRYGTQGKNDVEFCHPFLKPHINPTRNIAMAGNFNLVNTDELFQFLEAHPTTMMRESDLGGMIEMIHYYLSKADDANPEQLNIESVLQQATKHFDGGFVCGGLVGNGDSFVMRDANGIRPAFYYQDDEIAVVTSERPAIQTTFNVPFEKIHEVKPGHAIVIKKDGRVKHDLVREPGEKKSCSFERIYFSRGTDKEIYEERKLLGYYLCERILKAIHHDFENTVFSFIPNTAEVAFYGLMKGMEDYLNQYKKDQIISKSGLTDEEVLRILSLRVRMEKIAVKDVKARTFIADDSSRDEMVSHVYDITYGSVRADIDTLVVIDDSIVRGTTLQKSILSNLAKLRPKKIIIVSSAPQIRYPDCYGIDMSRMYDFVAFRALVDLLNERNWTTKLTEVYDKCKMSLTLPVEQTKNHVQELYDLFTADEISAKISEIVRPQTMFAEVTVLYQTIEDLHKACPLNTGDWYFTGNYPTPGGNNVANRAFINYMDGNKERAY